MSRTDEAAAGAAVDGRFLQVAARRYLVKGVTYGTFAPDPQGTQFPPRDQVACDFRMMVSAGLNTVRVYTPPRREVLDQAAEAGLKVMLGIPWTQHVSFLDDWRLKRRIRRDVVAAVRAAAGHPAVLLFALGNEIPAAVIRWHGALRVERFLGELLDDARAAAPGALFTYVNFPPTEFLELPNFDVCAFNVYLHRQTDLRAYLARLQNLAGTRPLLLAEAGADSLREGEEGQAHLTATHIETAFAEGCAGAIAFAWTDEWWRGGRAVDDWRFGLVGVDRTPKPALRAVSAAFAAAPFAPDVQQTWPGVSVVVCAYNAADTIGDCLSSLERLTYPDVEIIVVNDGSRDGTGDLARRFARVRVIDIPNGGLSAARNVGLRAATGEIVAYTDADVRVDQDWLTYLVQPLLASDAVGSGGPNVVPPDDPWMAQCVARAPGAPTHVLLDDRTAEHVPGCNMAFRREALLAVGGFTPTYVKAGDDVDLCWRLQARGWRIGFAPAAMVWHHHRATVRAYLRQQVGYGEGESWLMHDHPDKFAGRHVMWHGRIYSPLPFIRSLTRTRVNTGTWGLNAFPSVYHTAADPLAFLSHAAGWQLVSLALALAGALMLVASQGSAAWLLMTAGSLGLGITLYRCFACALATSLPDPRSTPPGRLRSRAVMRLTIAMLHLLQPWARSKGRLQGYLRPPETSTRVARVASRPWPRARELWVTLRLFAGAAAEFRFWNERWHGVEDLLHRLMTGLRTARLSRRIEFDDGWQQARDLAVAFGHWAAIDVAALVEEHAQGRVLTRVRLSLRLRWTAVAAVVAAFAAILVALSPVVFDAWPGATVVALAAAVACLAWIAWRTAGTLAGIRAVLSGTLATMGGVELDRGRPRLRFIPDTPVLAYAARTGLAAILAIGPLVGGGALVNEARMEVDSWRPRPVTAQRIRSQPPSAPWRAPRVGLAVAPNGDLYLADASADVIRRLSSRGVVSTVATEFRALPRGTAAVLGNPTGLDRFDTPGGVAVAPSGDLYVADAHAHRVYRVDRLTGATVVVAGIGVAGFSGDGGPAGEALLNTPSAVVLDRAGTVWIADSANHRVRRVQRNGIIDTVAGGGVATSAGDAGDGRSAVQAVLAWPSDLALAPNGDLYVADTEHHRVRRVDARSGVITTVAGSGRPGSTGDGGPAQRATLSTPTGLALVVRRKQTTIYIADSANGRVRVVAPDGTITSLTVPAGLSLHQPARLAYHPRGWLYVADAPDRVTALSLTGARSRALNVDARTRRAGQPM